MQNRNSTDNWNRKILFKAAVAAAFVAILFIPLAQAQEDVAGEPTDATLAEDIPAPPPETTLQRIAANGVIRFGYRTDARPFSYENEAGQPAGYSVVLCERIAEKVQAQLGLADLAAQWVPVTTDNRFSELAAGSVDMLCSADSATLSRRKEVAFSLPIFPGGVGALMRADAAARLRMSLQGQSMPNQPLWRGNPAVVLQHKTFSAIAGTTSESWLAERIHTFKISAKVVLVDSYDAGVEAVLKGSTDVMFGDRAILLDAMKRSDDAAKLMVVDRLFNLEPIALALPRGDEDFRLLVDTTLSEFYSSGEFGDWFSETFGEPNEKTLLFFLSNTLPE